MAEETGQEAPAPVAAAKGGKGRLVIIAGAVVLLAGGGGAAWWFGFLPHVGKTKSAEAASEDEAVKGVKPHAATLLALDPFIANLADEDGRRYLKASIQIELFDPAAQELINAHTPQMRDLLLTLFTSKQFAEIRTPQGKAVLRDEIINRMNRALGRDAVKAVYFTEFIVQ